MPRSRDFRGSVYKPSLNPGKSALVPHDNNRTRQVDTDAKRWSGEGGWLILFPLCRRPPIPLHIPEVRIRVDPSAVYFPWVPERYGTPVSVGLRGNPSRLRVRVSSYRSTPTSPRSESPHTLVHPHSPTHTHSHNVTPSSDTSRGPSPRAPVAGRTGQVDQGRTPHHPHHTHHASPR